MTLGIKRPTLAGKMPIEIIKKLLGEKKATVEANKKLLETRLAEEKTKESERKNFFISQTEKIVSSSRVLEGLRRIDRELLEESGVEKHQVFYFPEHGIAGVAWGDAFGVHNGFINVVTGTVCSSIEASIDPDRETLTIKGKESKTFDSAGWKNPDAVERALAEAYINPFRHYRTTGTNQFDGDAFGGGSGR